MQSITDLLDDIAGSGIFPPASTDVVLSLTAPVTCLSLGEATGDMGYCGGAQS